MNDVCFLETEFNRSRSTRDETKTRSTNSRQNPAYHHSHSTSSATTRTNKVQTHILRRLQSMNPAGSSNETTIDRILCDLSSIPTDLTNGKDY